jgi:hypothetical protein
VFGAACRFHCTSPATRLVKSYGGVPREHEYHPEARCADANGSPCRKQTVGLLGRRHIAIGGFVFIGKAPNKLGEVEAGGVPSESDVYTRFNDPRRDEWETKWFVAARCT